MKLSLGKTLILIVFGIFLICTVSCLRQEDVEEPIVVSAKIEEINLVAKPTDTFSKEDQEEIVDVPELITLGEFKLTAYCSCDICCGNFAYNRPVDEHGNEIVYGSIGERLEEGVSIAVDPSVIPYGTEVIINEHRYKAQDCGGAIDGNEIDVYFGDHQEALNFGVQYSEVFLVNN